jgi:hypothetical protein
VITGDISLCAGATGEIYRIDSVAGATSYTWTVTNGTIASGQNSRAISVNFTAAATATIEVTASNVCGTSDSSVLSVSVNALPAVTFTLPVDEFCSTLNSVALSGGSPAGGTYSGTAVTNGNFSPAIAGAGKFAITYSYTDGNGCEAAATDSVIVNVCSGIEDVNEVLGKVLVSPNPFNLFTIVEFEQTPEAAVNVVLADAEGRIVRNFNTAEKSFFIERNSLSTGMYYLILKSDNAVVARRRLVIQ